MEQSKFLDLVYKATSEYIETVQDIPVGVSNRHVHLCQQDLDILFGKGAALHLKKELGQPGQFAAEETINLRGPKGTVLERVRVLGPVRPQSQVEVSQTDAMQLGLSAPVRESGVLEETPGLIMEGPAGSVSLDYGVIIAWRHIHLSQERAQLLGVQDKEMVFVETEGPRGCILKNVLVRVSEKFAPEMHIDTDEANACGLKTGDTIRICKVSLS